MASEWDVLKAHARAQCVTAKDRLWCEMALALGEVALAMGRTLGPAAPKPEGYYTRTAKDYEAIRKAATAAEMARRARVSAERKAAKAAKQAAREERKRMRRSVASEGGWYDLGMAACLEQLQAYAAEVRDGRRCGRDERMMRSRRERARMAELRYAIACAEAGAVPGGRVH